MSSHCKRTLEPNDLQQYCGPLSCVYVFPSHGGKPRRSSILTCIAGEIEEQGCWNKFSRNQRGGGFMKGKFVIHLKTAVCCWKPQPGGWRTIYSRIYSASAYNQQSPKKKKETRVQVCTTICLKQCSILHIMQASAFAVTKQSSRNYYFVLHFLPSTVSQLLFVEAQCSFTTTSTLLRRHTSRPNLRIRLHYTALIGKYKLVMTNTHLRKNRREENLLYRIVSPY